jgi:hypothetical protein
MGKIVRMRHASEPSFQSIPEECMNVLRTACAGAAVLALAFGAASPVYAASAPTAVAHVTVAPADGPSGGDNGGWWTPRWHHHRHFFMDDHGRRHHRDHDHGRRHHRDHDFFRDHGFRHHHFVHAGGGAMATSVAGLTAHIGG